jgi:hypothetical protein
MTHRNSPAALAIALLLAAGTAFAQDASEEAATPADQEMTAKMAYEMSRNTRGTVEYCIGKGYLTADSRKHAQLLVELMQPMAPKAHDGDAVERLGKEGKVMVEGVAQPLSSAPMGEAQWCKDMGAGMEAGAAQFGG